MYIKSGDYHQVININTNLAEAINYGSDEWNAFTANQSLFCLCKNNKLQQIDPNPETICTIKTKRTNVYMCQMEECGYYSINWKQTIKHCKLNHGNTTSIEKLYNKYPERKKLLYFCETCKIKMISYSKHIKTQRHIKSKPYCFLYSLMPEMHFKQKKNLSLGRNTRVFYLSSTL